MSSKSSFYNSTGVTNTQSNAIEASVDNAEASATASENSANSASTSASTATTKAAEASASATTATTKASEASTSAATATTKASEISTSAATATTKASESVTSATASADSATSASTSASTATTKASEASSSASTALSHKNDAQTAKTAAETAETNAETAETNAASSATAASTSASGASTSATTATTKASEALTSASTATTKASEAATSASNASTSATTATTKASEASSSATSAASSASAASASKDAALAALDSFDDRYLGVKSSNPSVDNDGNALVAGSLYFNSTDDTMKVYEGSTWVAAYASSSGAVLQTGGAMTGNLSFGDNDKAVFGAGSDLQIYHDGSSSYISDQGTGDIKILANRFVVNNSTNSETMIFAVPDGAVTLYNNGSQKLTTLTTGISITGNATFADNGKAIFGAGSDLEIYSDGTHSFISEGNATGSLFIKGTHIYLQNSSGQDALNLINGNAFLKSGGNTKLATTSTGIDVTGDITLGDSNPQITMNDSSTANLQHLIVSSSDKLLLSADHNNVDAGTKIEFAVDGTERMEVTTTGIDVTGTIISDGLTVDGNVGIGTSSPSSMLNLKDWSGDGPVIRLDGAGQNSANTLLGALEFYNADNSADGANVTGAIRHYSAESLGQGGYTTFHTHDGTEGGEGSYAPERMRISSDGDVGIGTTSPSRLLTVSPSTGSAQIGLISQDSSQSEVLFGDAADDNVGRVYYDHASNSMSLWTNAAERMRIDSSGNLLVGKTSTSFSTAGFRASPSGTIQPVVDGGSTANFNRLTSDGDIVDFRKDGSTVGSIGTSAGDLTVGNNATTLKFHDGLNAIHPNGTGSGSDGNTTLGWSNNRFKDLYLSGNAYTDTLLVGKTSTSITTRGLFVDSNGTLKPTSDGAVGMLMNRKTSDGDIIEFRKDNTTVGSIGVAAGDNLYIGSTATNHGGIYMNDSGVLPMSAGAVSDNTKDLGNPSFRWNDFFLGGGVYLGGTGSANKLDDYEEGTFTAGVSEGTIGGGDGVYVKVGNMVYVGVTIGNFSNTSSGNAIRVTGLPFTSHSTGHGSNGSVFCRYISGGFPDATQVDSGATTARMWKSGSTAWASVNHNDITNGGNAYFFISLTYRAA